MNVQLIDHMNIGLILPGTILLGFTYDIMATQTISQLAGLYPDEKVIYKGHAKRMFMNSIVVERLLLDR